MTMLPEPPLSGTEMWRVLSTTTNHATAAYNNPYFSAYELSQRYDKDVVKGQLKLKWDVTNKLSLQGRFSGVINKLFEDRESPKSYLNYGDPPEGDYKTWNNARVNIDNDVLLSHHNQPGSDFVFTLNAGASTFYHRYQQEYNATDGLIVPEVYSLNNSAGNFIASTYLQERAIRSVYGMANLDWKDALFLTVAARNDWSSTLSTLNNSYYYPSVSLSGLVSNMIKMPEIVDYLKVYGSWAEVSSDLNPYQIAPVYANSGSYGGLPRITYPSGIVNPAIEPEKSISLEVGLASQLLKSRLGFDFPYYQVVDENQILDLSISEASGFTSRKVNGNQYTTEGFELILNAVPVKSSRLQWSTQLNLSHMVKRLSGIYGGEEKYGNYSLNERIDNFYSTAWMKAPEGSPILNETTGLPVRDPFPRAFGHSEPDLRFGWTNSLKFGKLDIQVVFAGWLDYVL